MTVNVARRRAAAIATPSTEAPTAIGEFEPTTFACPACTRPLAIGARRCPGCGTRFIMRVELRRASLFIGFGLLTGLMVGGGLTAVTSAVDRSAREARIAADAAAAALAAVEAARPDTGAPASGSGGTSCMSKPPKTPALRYLSRKPRMRALRATPLSVASACAAGGRVSRTGSGLGWFIGISAGLPKA